MALFKFSTVVPVVITRFVEAESFAEIEHEIEAFEQDCYIWHRIGDLDVETDLDAVYADFGTVYFTDPDGNETYSDIDEYKDALREVSPKAFKRMNDGAFDETDEA